MQPDCYVQYGNFDYGILTRDMKMAKVLQKSLTLQELKLANSYCLTYIDENQ